MKCLLKKSIILSQLTIFLLFFPYQVFADPFECFLPDPSRLVSNMENIRKYIPLTKSDAPKEAFFQAIDERNPFQLQTSPEYYDETKNSLRYPFVRSFVDEVASKWDVSSFSNAPNQCLFKNDTLNDFDQFIVYKGLTKTVDDVKKEIALKAAWSTIGDSLSQTPLGEELVLLTETVSSYLVIEYSIGSVSDDPSLYLPGQMSAKKMKEKKAFKISMAPLFYTDAESLSGNLSFKFGLDCYNTQTETVYNLNERELSINLENSGLDKLMGTKLLLCYLRDKDHESSGLVEVNIRF